MLALVTIGTGNCYYRKIVDRKGNVFEGIADYNSKTPKVRAKYI